MVEIVLTKVKEFFRTRTVAFYIASATALLSIVLSIVYACGYNGTDYMSWAVFALTLVAGIAFFALAIFKQTEAFAPLVMGLLDFIAFLVFIHAVYLYFSTVFYGGFSASLLGSIDPSFYACTVFFLVTIIASNVCVYLKKSKPLTVAADSEPDGVIEATEPVEAGESATEEIPSTETEAEPQTQTEEEGK